MTDVVQASSAISSSTKHLGAGLDRIPRHASVQIEPPVRSWFMMIVQSRDKTVVSRASIEGDVLMMAFEGCFRAVQRLVHHFPIDLLSLVQKKSLFGNQDIL